MIAAGSERSRDIGARTRSAAGEIKKIQKYGATHYKKV